MLEKHIEKIMTLYLDAVQEEMRLCYWVVKASGQPQMFNGKMRLKKSTMKGFPDILLCIHGLFVGVEVKTPTGRQSESQKIVEENIKKSSGIYWLLRTPEELRERLEGLWLNLRNTEQLTT